MNRRAWRRLGARIAIASACAGLVTVVAVSDARADGRSGFLTPGGLLTFVGGRHPAVGLGGEISYMHYESGRSMIGFGPFGQAQTYFGSGRYAFGMQGGGPVGLEVGAAYRTRDEAYADQWGVHLALFGSVGFLSLGARGTIPVNGGLVDGRQRQGAEMGLVIKLGGPIPLYGADDFGPKISGNFGSGRGLRDGDEIVLASVARREDWAEGPSPIVAGIDDDTRDRIAGEWLADALLEHASIAAFQRLARELDDLGAPADLVRRAEEAASDETDHTRRCFAIASAYAGAPLGPGAMRSPAPRAACFATIARESFFDGCFGEGAATKIARWSHARAVDPAVRETLAVIARDEARHADLAWDVLAFAVAASPLARSALANSLEIAPNFLEPNEPTEDGALTAIAADHGRAPSAVVARIRRIMARACEERARSLVGRQSRPIAATT